MDWTHKLSEAEKNLLIKKSQEWLSPVNGTVAIQDPVEIQTYWGNGHDRRQQQELVYPLSITGNLGDVRYSWGFRGGEDVQKEIVGVAWQIAHQYWSAKDGDIKSSLADFLWKKNS